MTIGDHAKGFYYSIHTQQLTENSSDAIYLSRTDSFPPIMIGVQHMVDLKYYLELVSQGVSIALHCCASPVFVTFATSSVSNYMKKRIRICRSTPFLKQIRHCSPWASGCYFITGESISPCLTEEPLQKFVALSLFVLKLSSSRAENRYCLDPTMGHLHSIADQILCGEAQLINRSLLNLCVENQRSVMNDISSLDEIDISATTKQIVRESMEEDVRLYNAHLVKYYDRELYLLSVEAGLISEAISASSSIETFPAYPPIVISEDTPSEFSSVGRSEIISAPSEFSSTGRLEVTPVPLAYPFIGSSETIPELLAHPSLERSESIPAPLAYASFEESETVPLTHISMESLEPTPVPLARPRVKNSPLPIRNRSEGWDYISKRLSEIDEKAAIPWSDIFEEGKVDGYFSMYKSSGTMRSAYCRRKKNNL